MYEVKIGDKVRCIDDTAHPNGPRSLEKGKVYTVNKINGQFEWANGHLGLEGVPLLWKVIRFKPAKITNEERIQQRKEELNAV